MLQNLMIWMCENTGIKEHSVFEVNRLEWLEIRGHAGESWEMQLESYSGLSILSLKFEFFLFFLVENLLKAVKCENDMISFSLWKYWMPDIFILISQQLELKLNFRKYVLGGMLIIWILYSLCKMETWRTRNHVIWDFLE